MKTNERMILVLIGAATCSFFFGLGQHEVPAQVANCPQSCCETLYSWWINGAAGGGTNCYSAQVTGATWPFAVGDNTNHAIAPAFLPVVSGGGCKVKQSGTFDRWIWKNNTPACAKNAKGILPSPQSVTPNTPPPTFDQNVARSICVVK